MSPVLWNKLSCGKIPGYRPAEGHGEGIGGVRGDRVADSEEAGDHPGDLLLGGAAVPGRRGLDLLGAVFVDADAVDAAGDDRGAARLAEFEGGGRIFREENLLDRGFRRPVEKDQVGEFAVDPEETVGEVASLSSRMTPHATGETAFPRTSTIPYPVRSDPGSIPRIRRRKFPPSRGPGYYVS